MGPGRDTFYVVVPFYNEEKAITQTLESLAAQTDTAFTLLLVDNNSDDGGAVLVDAWCARHPGLRVQVIGERQKGTGAASDTGFRQAIAQGATLIARTDADCLPAFDWVARIKQAFAGGQLEFLIGRVEPRDDGHPPGRARAVADPAAGRHQRERRQAAAPRAAVQVRLYRRGGQQHRHHGRPLRAGRRVSAHQHRRSARG